MSTRSVLLTLATVLATVAIAPLHAAEPSAPTSIIVAGPSRAPLTLSIEELARLPTVRVNVAFLTEHGTHSASFEGPLLWTVLQKAGVVDPAMHREQVSESVVILGRDGYRAVLALGEIAPEFEGKQVILAERMNDQPLDAEQLRIIVPLDKRGGRSVREVARIEVTPPLTGSQ
jgi:DMSO/TMAO reductase YedYZ molybdopterin-dependent catalytic subunit